MKEEVWLNKKSGQLVIAKPWYDAQLNEKSALCRGPDDVQVHYAVVVQVGYWIENEHGCNFGFNFSVKDAFESLGAL